MIEKESDNHIDDYHKGVCIYCGFVADENQVCEQRKKRNKEAREAHGQDIGRLCQILSQLTIEDLKFLVRMTWSGHKNIEDAVGQMEKNRDLEERDF